MGLQKDQAVTPETFTFSLNKKKLRVVRQREGHYLLRSNLGREDPATLWQYYLQLTEVEQAFKELKGDLSIRPIYHQKDTRIEAHIFVAFVAYSLSSHAQAKATGLGTRTHPAGRAGMAALQMVDVHLPTTDGRHLVLPRYTQPDKDQRILLHHLKMTLPAQPPPRLLSNAGLSV